MGCPLTFLLVRRALDLLRLGLTPDEKHVEIAVLLWVPGTSSRGAQQDFRSRGTASRRWAMALTFLYLALVRGLWPVGRSHCRGQELSAANKLAAGRDKSVADPGPIAGAGPRCPVPRTAGAVSRGPGTAMRDRPLIIVMTAGMGAGHDQVGRELSSRLSRQGVGTELVDVGRLLPVGFGRGLTGLYKFMAVRAPWLYGLTFQLAMRPQQDQPAAASAPLAVLARHRLHDWSPQGNRPSSFPPSISARRSPGVCGPRASCRYPWSPSCSISSFTACGPTGGSTLTCWSTNRSAPSSLRAAGACRVHLLAHPS